MDSFFDTKYEKITLDTELKVGDLIYNHDRINNKIIHYKIVRIKLNAIRILSMAIYGDPIVKSERSVLELTKKSIIQQRFHLLVDNSNDKDYWPESIEEAILKLMQQFSSEEIANIKKLSWTDFNNNYNNFGGLSLWIRNYFGLYRGNYELLLNCEADESNADNISSIIVYRFWEHIKDYEF